MKIKQVVILAVIFALIPASFAFAHKVIIFAWVEAGMIYTESSFGSKRKAKDSLVTVIDEKGIIIHKGQTDREGNYSFKIPAKIDSDLIVKLDAGTGHQAQWRISKDELMTVPSPDNIQAAMKKKEKLEESPSIFKIIGGIGIIFMLAMAAKFFKRKIS
jgi:nickel transport protein